jgi:hypothetical protein
MVDPQMLETKVLTLSCVYPPLVGGEVTVVFGLAQQPLFAQVFTLRF